MKSQEEINDDALKTIFEAETEEVQEEEKQEQPQEVEEQPQEITAEETKEAQEELNPVDPAFQKVLAKSATAIYNKGVPAAYNMFFSEKLKNKTLFDIKEEKDELKTLEYCSYVIIKNMMQKLELNESSEVGIAITTILMLTGAKLATAPKVVPPAPKPKGQGQIFEMEQETVKKETRGRKKKTDLDNE